MTEIVWIARHGNRLDFVDPEWFNTAEWPYDPPLSADGMLQARLLGDRLLAEKIDHIFSSPFLRCVQTADQIAQLLQLPIKIESGLSEWLNPEWFPYEPQTLSLETLAKRFPRVDSGYKSYLAPEYPENDGAALRRTGEAAERLTSGFAGSILLVGHGVSLLGTMLQLLRKSLEDRDTFFAQTPCCCLSRLKRQDQAWVLEMDRDISHWK
ncbi:MAG: histidine phosphatase family protein [Acidobacteria bacterium]|nr:histidine phosphatase family protein [Acidobacteriota bacterium]